MGTWASAPLGEPLRPDGGRDARPPPRRPRGRRRLRGRRRQYKPHGVPGREPLARAGRRRLVPPPRRSSERPDVGRFGRSRFSLRGRLASDRYATREATTRTTRTKRAGGTQLLTRTVSAFVHEERRDDVRCLFDTSSRRTRVSRLLVPNLNRDVARTRRRASPRRAPRIRAEHKAESHIVPRTARARTTHSPPSSKSSVARRRLARRRRSNARAPRRSRRRAPRPALTARSPCWPRPTARAARS